MKIGAATLHMHNNPEMMRAGSGYVKQSQNAVGDELNR